MKIVICGAGQVGYGIAESLAGEGHDVSVLDSQENLIADISNNLNVRGFVGHASFPEALERAGAAAAEMIIAVTLHDEVNMVICQIAHTMFDVGKKIARIRAQDYLLPQYEDLFSPTNMPVDVVISPEIEVGEMIMRRLSQPGSFESASFGGGLVSLIGVVCAEDCPLLDTPLTQLAELFPDLDAVITGIIRNGRLFVPGRNDQLLVGDEVYVIVRQEHISRTLTAFGQDQERARRIVLVGAGNIGLYLAERLEALHDRVNLKIIEVDRDRAIHVAERLQRTIILHGSGLDEEVLKEAGIEEADMLLAVTNDDQVNILSSVVARSLGCKKNLTLLNNRKFTRLAPMLGIETHVNPRAITVSKILQYVRSGQVSGVYSINTGEAEVIETEALETAPITGRKVRDLNLSDGIKIGAILRHDNMLVPHGDTVIKPKDKLIIFALTNHIREVEELFSVSLEFF